jgi:hypothetical protein
MTLETIVTFVVGYCIESGHSSLCSQSRRVSGLSLLTSQLPLTSDSHRRHKHKPVNQKLKRDQTTVMSGESEYVTLISSDGYSFIVQRSSACISGAIKRMLDPSCTS